MCAVKLHYFKLKGATYTGSITFSTIMQLNDMPSFSVTTELLALTCKYFSNEMYLEYQHSGHVITTKKESMLYNYYDTYTIF